MSDPRSKDRASLLDALVRDAKQDLTPRIDDEAFASMEERIVARMAEERGSLSRPAVASHGAGSTGGRVLRIGALVLAAAAAFAVVAKREPGGGLIETGPGGEVELTAGSLRATEGAGEVRVGGRPASPGHLLRAGDVVEAEGARAVLERPRKVTWLLESNVATPGTGEGSTGARVARVRVKSAGESLILGLDDGAIEAQVMPVPSGEAFAVDVAAGTSLVRVAVHGTHLRVSRVGSRVVIDLTEGVVSIGVPPRTGSTYGTLVTAPSHVEFDATDLERTLRIDHAPDAVRAPVALGPHDPSDAVGARAATPSRETPAPAAVPPSTTVARPAADPSHVDRPSGGARPGPYPTKPALPPHEAIAAAVQSCAAARSRPENVRVTVSSSLKLKIAASGGVETAQFDPPLLPEIQACAAAAIYKAKLDDSAGATVTIPIDFSY